MTFVMHKLKLTLKLTSVHWRFDVAPTMFNLTRSTKWSDDTGMDQLHPLRTHWPVYWNTMDPLMVSRTEV